MDLEFISEEDVQTAYETKTKYNKTTLHGFLIDKMDVRSRVNYLAILTKVGEDLWIPMLDVDESTKFPVVENRLASMELSFIRMSSSPDKSWYFVDQICNFKEAIEFIKKFDGLTHIKHIIYCSQTGRICLRGHIKDLFKPQINLMSGKKFTTLFKQFVQLLNNHFNSEILSFIAVLDSVKQNSKTIDTIFPNNNIDILEWGEEKDELWDQL